MAFDYVAAEELLLVLPHPVPVIKGWNRLEGRPRAVDFERALRAEVRDALWFLTRQWQFGEFQGEDAASPVDARTRVQSAQFTRYAPKGSPVTTYTPEVPLEARVEAEALPADLVTHLQVTRYFFGLIADAPRLALIKSRYLDPGAYALAPVAVAGAFDADATAMLSFAIGRTLDGVRLLADIASGAHATKVDGFAGLDDAEMAALDDAGDKLLAWSRRLYCTPEKVTDTAWAPRYLEYQFACSTDSGTAQSVLAADQYDQGRLDWYAFDVDASSPGALPPPGAPAAGTPAAPAGPALSFIPAPVSFAGMPSHRYWEFESRRTEFADIDANTTDVAKLLLTEFVLVSGNDWCVIPYEIDVGTLSDVPGLLVTDDMGETTLVSAAGHGLDDQWQRWSMFTLTTNATGGSADTRLLLAPTVTKTLESDLLEAVLFLRDEMANMVWAVERTVPDAAGGGADGYAVARAGAVAPTVPPLHPTIANARYTLGTDVPHNWHPFIPVHVPDSNRSVQLQRAKLPGPSRELYGQVLRVASPYYLNEEEVPRAGKMVSRAFQRARWPGGSTFLWLGRRAATGHGEGSSGLAFDQVDDIKADKA
jgi:hypothetical protein